VWGVVQIAGQIAAGGANQLLDELRHVDPSGIVLSFRFSGGGTPSAEPVVS
jgi:hypothetical protein